MSKARHCLLAILTASTMASGTFLGVSTASASTAVQLTFWSWVPGENNAVKLFNTTHPGIHVTLDNVGRGAPEYTKLSAALKAGNAPDVVQLEYPIGVQFASAGDLANIKSYLPANFKSNFIPAIWDQVSFGNAVYGVPQDSGPEVLFYRADIFHKYHIPVPTTWTQYATDAQLLHKADPVAFITNFPATESPWWEGAFGQQASAWFRPDGNEWAVNIDSASSLAVGNYWGNLLSKGLISSDGDWTPAWYHDLATGGIVSWVSGAWGDATLEAEAPKTSGDWRAALMPQPSSKIQATGDYGGCVDAVTKDSRHVGPATEFAEWLNTNSKSWKTLITQGGLYPAYKPALSSPALNAKLPFFGNQDVGAVFAQAAKNLKLAPFSSGPMWATVATNMSNLFTSVASKKITMADALKQLQSSSISTLRSAGYKVKS